MRRAVRILAAILCAVASWAITAPAASAHNTVIGSTLDCQVMAGGYELLCFDSAGNTQTIYPARYHYFVEDQDTGDIVEEDDPDNPKPEDEEEHGTQDPTPTPEPAPDNDPYCNNL